jgi:hypothetical protein
MPKQSNDSSRIKDWPFRNVARKSAKYFGVYLAVLVHIVALPTLVQAQEPDPKIPGWSPTVVRPGSFRVSRQTDASQVGKASILIESLVARPAGTARPTRLRECSASTYLPANLVRRHDRLPQRLAIRCWNANTQTVGKRDLNELSRRHIDRYE